MISSGMGTVVHNFIRTKLPVAAPMSKNLPPSSSVSVLVPHQASLASRGRTV